MIRSSVLDEASECNADILRSPELHRRSSVKDVLPLSVQYAIHYRELQPRPDLHLSPNERFG